MPSQRPTLQYCDCDSSEMASKRPATMASSPRSSPRFVRFVAAA